MIKIIFDDGSIVELTNEEAVVLGKIVSSFCGVSMGVKHNNESKIKSCVEDMNMISELNNKECIKVAILALKLLDVDGDE